MSESSSNTLSDKAATAACSIQPIPLPAMQLTPNANGANSANAGPLPSVEAIKGMFENSQSPYCPFPESVLKIKAKRQFGCWNGGPHDFCTFVPSITSLQSSSFESKSSYRHTQTMKAKSSGFSIGIGSIGFGFVKAKSSAQLSENADGWVGWHLCNGVLVGWVKHCVNCEASSPPHDDRENMLKLLMEFALQQNLSPEQEKKIKDMGLQISRESGENFASAVIENEFEKESLMANVNGNTTVELSHTTSRLNSNISTREFLQSLKLYHLIENFENENITISQIQHLEKEDFEELGVKMGERRLIISKVKELLSQ